MATSGKHAVLGRGTPPQDSDLTARIYTTSVDSNCVLFSPKNEAYGINGTHRMCWNGQAEENYQKCLAGKEVWFSDWGYEEEGKAHARLTFNPYFDWQAGVMLRVLESTRKN